MDVGPGPEVDITPFSEREEQPELQQQCPLQPKPHEPEVYQPGVSFVAPARSSYIPFHLPSHVSSDLSPVSPELLPDDLPPFASIASPALGLPEIPDLTCQGNTGEHQALVAGAPITQNKLGHKRSFNFSQEEVLFLAQCWVATAAHHPYKSPDKLFWKSLCDKFNGRIRHQRSENSLRNKWSELSRDVKKYLISRSTVPDGNPDEIMRHYVASCTRTKKAFKYVDVALYLEAQENFREKYLGNLQIVQRETRLSTDMQPQQEGLQGLESDKQTPNQEYMNCSENIRRNMNIPNLQINRRNRKRSHVQILTEAVETVKEFANLTSTAAKRQKTVNELLRQTNEMLEQVNEKHRQTPETRMLTSGMHRQANDAKRTVREIQMQANEAQIRANENLIQANKAEIQASDALLHSTEKAINLVRDLENEAEYEQSPTLARATSNTLERSPAYSAHGQRMPRNLLPGEPPGTELKEIRALWRADFNPGK